MKFDVYKLPNKLPFVIPEDHHWTFDNANKVAMFMFGRSPMKHVIYRNGEFAYLAYLFANVEALQEYLEGDLQFPNVHKKEVK
jgi:hypothetical protein